MPRLWRAALSRLVPLVPPAHLGRRTDRRSRGGMLDLVFLLLTLGSFALLGLYVTFCERT
jgi:hypothetical protein